MEIPEKIKEPACLKKGDLVYVWFPDKKKYYKMKIEKITKHTFVLISGNVTLRFDKKGFSKTEYQFELGHNAYIIKKI